MLIILSLSLSSVCDSSALIFSGAVCYRVYFYTTFFGSPHAWIRNVVDSRIRRQWEPTTTTAALKWGEIGVLQCEMDCDVFCDAFNADG